MLQLISNVFGAIKEFFGFQSKKLDLNNTEEMKKSETLKKEQQAVDKTNKAIAEKDEDEIRKELS